MNKGQRFMLFMLVFAGTAGVLRVDEAYSDMMDREGMLTLTVRRVDEENIRVGTFGMSNDINIRDVEEQWDRISASVTGALDQATSSVRQLIGLFDGSTEEQAPLRTVVFPVETL